MASLNRVFLIGRLTQDPKLRYTPSGTPVTDLRLAVNRTYTDPSGQRKEETVFLDVVVWRKQAEICCEYLAKGRQVMVEGRLTMDTWQGNDGQKRSRIRVVADRCQFLDPRGERGERGGGSTADYGRSYRETPAAPVAGGREFGDESGGYDEPPQEELPEADDTPF
ncbi:MAG: single-stranded DNA-binding protein [Planctomycetes bacterium]|nr:single-stranded DNA-binding protein [Planctomycetota bacterium]